MKVLIPLDINSGKINPFITELIHKLAVIAEKLEICFDVAVVSKITLPWNTETGYGAVAFDGTCRLNRSLLSRLDLSETDIHNGIEKTTEKVLRRLKRLRGEHPFPDLSDRCIILVDDGLASGFTMKVAIQALRNLAAKHIRVGRCGIHFLSEYPKRLAICGCRGI